MLIITVLNNKGGIGKTTTSTILIELAAREKKARVVGVDICGQQNLVDNLSLDGETLFGVDVAPSAGRTPPEGVLREYDYAVIDTPPNVESSVISKIIKFSDALVVPFDLEKHSVYGVDEVAKMIPDTKPIFFLCIAERESNLSVVEKQLFDLAQKSLGDRLYIWPRLKRVKSNVSLHDAFDVGVGEEHKKRFTKLFKDIKKAVK